MNRGPIVHLITGAVIAALLGKKSKQSGASILHIRGVLETAHHIPGRIRFHIPALKHDESGCADTDLKLQNIEGIETVQANEITGSLLVHYNDSIIKADLIAAAIIRILRLDAEIEKTPEPAIPRELRELGRSLNRAVYEKTGGLLDLWSTIPLLLVAVAGRKIVTERVFTAPAAVTLLWWGYNSLFQQNHRSD